MQKVLRKKKKKSKARKKDSNVLVSVGTFAEKNATFIKKSQILRVIGNLRFQIAVVIADFRDKATVFTMHMVC